MRSIVIALLFSTALQAQRRQPYRYNLDPLTAEQLLSTLIIKPRLTDQQWKALLTARLKARRGLASEAIVNERYRVSRGDNLWNISKKNLGTPWYWPKLWASNADIANPHEIETGRLLAYYRESTEPTITIPLLKLIPSGGGKVTSLENDTFLTAEIKNRYRPTVAILTDDDPIIGTVRGSYTNRSILYVHERIYVEPFGDQTLVAGQTFSVVRKERALRDGTFLAGRVLGDLVRVVGEITIERVDEGLAVAEIKGLTHTMKRGDWIVPTQNFFDLSVPLSNPPDDLHAKVIQGEEEQSTLMGQGQIVLVNRGSNDGMRPGFKFRILRDQDPVTNNTADVLPDFKGEIRIVATSKDASVAYILRNEEPILIGDLLVPAQRFANRPSPPRRPVNVLEVE